MKERRSSFNLFLSLAALILCWGVHGATPEEKKLEKDLEQKKKIEAKQMAQIRVYREVIEFSGRASELGTLGVNKATVGRSDPVEMTVQREAVLDERDVKRATLVEQRDQSFSIAVEFVQRGSMVLHMNSVAAKGQRLVIAARWSNGTNVFNRWIAAPLMRRALDQGVIVFTPDMSREESVLFVRGLNNVAVKLKNQTKPPKEKKTKPADSNSTNAAPGSKTAKPKAPKADTKPPLFRGPGRGPGVGRSALPITHGQPRDPRTGRWRRAVFRGHRRQTLDQRSVRLRPVRRGSIA